MRIFVIIFRNRGHLQIITTRDGSHTLTAPFTGEHYHSLHGAIEESRHVYIESGVGLFGERCEISVLEVGFGTGLNALLSLQYARANKIFMRYVTLETNPIDINIASMLNYGDLVEDSGSDFMRFHELPWNEDHKFDEIFVLEKLRISLRKIEYDNEFDVVFFDAFGPRFQPELWERDMFKKIFQSIKPEGLLVTFCAKGQVKRDMASVGFRVDTIPGPPGKREMIRAHKDMKTSVF